MNKTSLDKLRFDRRLRHRRDWVSNSDYSQEIESLPDVADKIAPLDEVKDAASAAGTGSPNDEV